MTFRKTVAWWLLLLALSPFTAPFSTCNLLAFSRSYPTEGAHIAKFFSLPETRLDDCSPHAQSPQSPAAGCARFFLSSQAAVGPRAPTSIGFFAGPFESSSRSLCRSSRSRLLRI